ncbi:DUF1906 domain-containing protein [Kitasatospora sp. McL0602]|uniref:DUF1906 domain-containing protein n=1 Tax=Kitasatospora sp. McL0602 TaxID=3439530 RepID=UPI003F8A795E
MRHLVRQAAVVAAALALLLPGAATAANAAPVQPGRRAPEVFHGLGFDACSTPPLATMRAWYDASPYRAVGVYASGTQRACPQTELTADWVREVRAMGWRVIPIHVGPQAPCNTYAYKTERLDPARAAEQGREQAVEAVAALAALGLGKGSPVYLDIEAYGPRDDPTCSPAVVDAAAGWTAELHRAGYVPGFYSSLASGVRDLTNAVRAGRAPLPDVLWYARWDHKADTAGSGEVPDDLWVDQQRIHQYEGNVQETWGGATLSIDRNRLDGPVAT